jgi:ClpP class serine protease
LVDELGTLDDAIAEVAKEAKIKGKPRIAYPSKKSRSLQDMIMGGGRDDEDGFEEEHSFVDKIVSRVADRMTGIRPDETTARPAGMYVLWNGR